MKKDASGVVIHGNEKGKMLEPHALLCVHTSKDTPSPFTIVWTRMLRWKETIIMFTIMLS